MPTVFNVRLSLIYASLLVLGVGHSQTEKIAKVRTKMLTENEAEADVETDSESETEKATSTHLMGIMKRTTDSISMTTTSAHAILTNSFINDTIVSTIASQLSDNMTVLKAQPKYYVLLLPPIFSVIGISLIVLSMLTTVLCAAYCVFLPWVHALSSFSKDVSNIKSSQIQGTSAPNINEESVIDS